MTAIDPDAVIDVVDELGDLGGGRGAALAIGAFLLGAGIGSGLGYILAKKRVTAQANARADAEIEEMREHYRAKGVALESTMAKGDLSKIVREKGYTTPEPTMSTSPPMAVQPPSSVVEAEDEEAGEPPDDSEMAEDDIEGPNGVKVQHRNIFRDQERSVPHEWVAADERKRRSPDRPYVIHQDEWDDLEGFQEVHYTYYSADDVLCNERDEVVDPDRERDRIVGEANLERFGHGAEDPNIVHIRNDNLELVIEIVKSPNSFAEEVHGFTHEGWDRGNLERMRRRERDVET